MRIRFVLGLSIVTALAAAPAFGSFTGGPKNEPPPTSTTPEMGSNVLIPRQEAERLYADGYDDIARAKKALADGKGKNAEKKLKRALDRGQRAVELDPKYHEAWNLVGYAARKLKDYDRALAAYEKCLALKPDYVSAREYLGEAYVELGNPKKAREQLAWLERLVPNSEDTRELRAAIAAYDSAHPAVAADSSRTPPAARADSSAAGSGGR